MHGTGYAARIGLSEAGRRIHDAGIRYQRAHDPGVLAMEQARRADIEVRIREALDGVTLMAPPRPLHGIIVAVCEHFDVWRNDLLSARRNRRFVVPRQVAMYLAKEMTAMSLPQIGRHLGGRDHTTVLHGIRKVAALIAAGDPVAADVRTLRMTLTSGEGEAG